MVETRNYKETKRSKQDQTIHQI